MFFKLVIVLGFVAILGNCAPDNREIYQQLIEDPRFLDYYHQQGGKQGDDGDIEFMMYIMATQKKFKDWQSKLQDPSSQEYQALVAAQSGNRNIPTDQKQLLSQYLETLYNTRPSTNPAVSSNSVSSSMPDLNITELENLDTELQPKPRSNSPAELARQREAAKIQAKNAQYSFGFSIDDNIVGSYQQRVERRKNGKVYGKYSYDDGNNFVTRYYVADENGFRVLKANSGPSLKKNTPLTGNAVVQYSGSDMGTGYQINAKDVKRCRNSGAQ